MGYTISIQSTSRMIDMKHNERNIETIIEELEKGYCTVKLDENGKPIFDYEKNVLENHDIKEMYNTLFSEAIEKFNKKQIEQNHYDRVKTVESYYNKLESNRMHEIKKGSKSCYEIIVQVGNMNNHPDDEVQRKILTDFYKKFKEKNKNLKVVQYIIHDDETGGMHAHLVYIPIKHQKRGMELDVSQEGALKELGFNSKGSRITAQTQFQHELRNELVEICKQNGIEASYTKTESHEEKQVHKNRLELELEAKEKEIAEINNHKEFMEKDILELDKQYSLLNDDIDIAQNQKKKLQNDIKELRKDYQTLDQSYEIRHNEYNKLADECIKLEARKQMVEECKNVKIPDIVKNTWTDKKEKEELRKKYNELYNYVVPLEKKYNALLKEKEKIDCMNQLENEVFEINDSKYIVKLLQNLKEIEPKTFEHIKYDMNVKESTLQNKILGYQLERAIELTQSVNKKMDNIDNDHDEI